jgi:hypothetical protein
MKLETSIPESFLELFYNEIECDIPNTNSKLNLYILRIENNKLCFPELYKELSNYFITFSLSRKEYEEFKKNEKYGELYTSAASRFRNYNSNEGEAGELLLYCFLESHLKAPKILTKLEIKLSSNDYAKGSDGVHILEVADRNYQLIFGESKLRQKLTSSISDAFVSINDFLTRKKNNIYDEIGLINSQLLKETINEDLYQFLKSVIMPKANTKDPIIKNNAFAIFAGFEFIPTEEEKMMGNDDFTKHFKQKIKSEVQGKMTHIEAKITEYDLQGYTFYVYVFPFMNLDETRKEIIKKITLAEK